MIAGQAYKMIAEFELDPLPFAAGSENFVDFYISQRKIALLCLVFEESVEGPEDEVKRITSHFSNYFRFGTFVLGFCRQGLSS